MCRRVECRSGHGLLSDCQILLELADQAFGTPRLNWAEDVPVQDWTGVELVGLPGRVHGVVLNNAGLVGVIPWSFGKLFSLRTLELRGNELQGNIPSSMTSLHQLETLDLRDNGLVGYLPDLTTLSRLQHLRLDRKRSDRRSDRQAGRFEYADLPWGSRITLSLV